MKIKIIIIEHKERLIRFDYEWLKKIKFNSAETIAVNNKSVLSRKVARTLPIR